SVDNAPTLICCKTVIGWGAPNKQGTAKTHGEALGEEEIALARKKLDWSHPPFTIPDELYEGWDAREKGKAWETAWDTLFTAYRETYPQLAQELLRRQRKQLPENWFQSVDTLLQEMIRKKETLATRKASQICLDHFSSLLPEMMGGSADLT